MSGPAAAVVGGGPGGLLAASRLRRLLPDSRVTLWERRPETAPVGFGVVFSGDALVAVEDADPDLSARLAPHLQRWASIDVRLDDELVGTPAEPFVAVERRTLLDLLRRRCRETGVDLRFGCEAPDPETLRAGHDLVVVADGAASRTRDAWTDVLATTEEPGPSRFLWLGCDRALPSLTFAIVRTPHGAVTAHAYPYRSDRSTMIAEMPEPVWRALGLDRRGPEASQDLLAELFASTLDGASLICDGRDWQQFTVVRHARWNVGPVALVGDAAHTTHFSLGSGTRLAMEDAAALAEAVRCGPDVPTALAAYDRDRRPVVDEVQRSAEISRRWFDAVDDWPHLPADQFAVHLLTRSGGLLGSRAADRAGQAENVGAGASL